MTPILVSGHKQINKDQWHGIWDKDEPHGQGLYVYYEDQTKVESPFIRQVRAPASRQQQAGSVRVAPSCLMAGSCVSCLANHAEWGGAAWRAA
jgi:hypothetical protein